MQYLVVHYVRLVLDDIIVALQLQNIVLMQEEVTIHSLRPDLLVLIYQSHPIGVVEVKAPSSSTVLDNKKVHGQMYDYLNRLKMYFGVDKVFGIITTYEQWRVFWLSDSCGAASSGILEKKENKLALDYGICIRFNLDCAGQNSLVNLVDMEASPHNKRVRKYKI